MTDPNEKPKVNFKLPNGATFEAENVPADLLKDLWKEFIEEARRTPPPAATAAASGASSQASPPPAGGAQAPSVDAGAARVAPPDSADLGRVFKDEGQGVISMTRMPSSVPDAILLLMYAHKVLKGTLNVKASALVDGLQKTGYPKVVRIDRSLGPHSELVFFGGNGRGRTYGLNNPGESMARSLLAPLMA